MKAEELGIGNLLRCGLTKSFLKVVEIKEDGFTTFVIDRSKFPLPKRWFTEPIPLTEEILLKCGFEKTLGRHGEYYFHGVFKGMRIWLDDITGNYTLGRKSDIPTGGRYNTYWIKGGIKHLHQLQNLYYTLTGKELEVKI